MEKHGYRVRMAKFRGMPSEALIMPQTIDGQVGDDVTEQAGVAKYEKPIPTCLAGEVYGDFPRFIPKTDEPNFQSVPEMVEAIKGLLYYATVKIDGSSGTAYRYDGHFGVCSRNWELKETDGNAFWRCMTEPWRNIPEGYAVQFEVAGPGIQGNPMGLKQILPFCFQVWNIREKRYLNFHEWQAACLQWGIPTVPVLFWGSSWSMDFSDDALRSYAEGTYPNGQQREGIVFRPIIERWMPAITGLNDHCSVGISSVNRRLSFKVINLLYRERP
jgi:RNA ligase (TIGR02306 family)